MQYTNVYAFTQEYVTTYVIPGLRGPRRATLPDAGRDEASLTMGILGLVIDAQIVGEQSDLERARTAKISKYADNPDIERAIQRETGATNIRHRPSSLGEVSGPNHPHQIFWHWAPSPREILLSSPPVCSSVVSSPTATSIVQPLSRSEDDIAQRRLPFRSLDAACRSRTQSTLNLVYVVRIKL